MCDVGLSSIMSGISWKTPTREYTNPLFYSPTWQIPEIRTGNYFGSQPDIVSMCHSINVQIEVTCGIKIQDDICNAQIKVFKIIFTKPVGDVMLTPFTINCLVIYRYVGVNIIIMAPYFKKVAWAIFHLL